MTRARRHLVTLRLNLKRCLILKFNSVRNRGLVHGTTRQQVFERLVDLARRECRCSLRGIGLILAEIPSLRGVLRESKVSRTTLLLDPGFSREMNKLHCVSMAVLGRGKSIFLHIRKRSIF